MLNNYHCKMIKVMAVGGSDSGGGAGIQADIKTFAVLRVYGTSVITSITAQNTLGVFKTYDLPPDIVVDQMETVITDIKVQFAKTGMLSNADITNAVADIIQNHRIPLVVDPVMAAEAGGSLVKESLRTVVEKLLPIATTVTPNIKEAEVLSGTAIYHLDDMKRAAREIYAFGPKSVIVTGGHLAGSDVLYNGEFEILKGSVIEGGTHGAGCTFSAAVTAFLAKGYNINQSASMAKVFVTDAIANSVKVGSGAGSVDQAATTFEKSERYFTIRCVQQALDALRNMSPQLIPEVGSNIVMATSNAKSGIDVAGVSGRIVRVGKRALPVGCIEFGASDHVARIVLTAMKYDANLKSAMNIRYSSDTINACENLGMTIVEFDRADEPEEVSTMEWGVARAMESSIAKDKKVPMVIYDRGGLGKEAMVRVLGSLATDVAGNVIRISSMVEDEHPNEYFKAKGQFL